MTRLNHCTQPKNAYRVVDDDSYTVKWITGHKTKAEKMAKDSGYRVEVWLPNEACWCPIEEA